MLPTLIKFYVKPHNTIPLAFINSGLIKFAISAIVLKAIAKNIKISTIIKIRATF